MADQPIGISFIPSTNNQQNGPVSPSVEGGPGANDLSQAFKILSLHLPQVLGAGALSPRRLLTSPGASGLGFGGITAPDVTGPGGLSDPNAAAFLAMIKAMIGSASMPSSSVGPSSSAMPSPYDSSSASSSSSTTPDTTLNPAPKVVYDTPPDPWADPNPPQAPQAPPTPPWVGSSGPPDDERDRRI